MKQFVVVLLLAARPAPADDLLRLESTLDAMGSSFSIVAYAADRLRLQAAVEEAFEEIRRLDAMLSNYKPRSQWSVVNRQAADGPVRVSPELFALLEACAAYSRASDGAFDITIGPLVRIWGFYRGGGRLPHRAEIRGALAKVGWRGLLLDRDHQTVRFARPGMEIDPGGIGKGYAVDRAVDVLRRGEVAAAMVSAGGSSIYGLGAPPGEDGWRVRIRHPREEAKTVAEVLLRDQSMSTSGSYEKSFAAGGKTYSHIFDPRTGYPAQGMLSVSVVAPDTIDSEAWTKPLFINGRRWASRHKPRRFRAYLCEDRLELACAWLP